MINLEIKHKKNPIVDYENKVPNLRILYFCSCKKSVKHRQKANNEIIPKII